MVLRSVFSHRPRLQLVAPGSQGRIPFVTNDPRRRSLSAIRLGGWFEFGQTLITLRSLAIILILFVPFRRLHAQDSLDTADSVVLERTACFGLCPAYLLHVSKSGAVLFESQNRGDEERRATDTIPAYKFQRILTRAMITDFLALPDRIQGDKRFCPRSMTDHPTAIVTIFLPSGPRRVEDYHGCYWAPVGLRQLEDAIDTIAGVSRWIRPNRRR